MPHASALVLVVVVTACSVRGPLLDPPPLSMGRRDIIQIDELRQNDDASTLLDVLRRTRPQMLRARSGTAGMLATEDAINVFIDGHYAGGVDVLAEIATSRVFSVRMVRPTAGYLRQGTQPRHAHALFVTTVHRYP